jgi:hypothetical protein
LAHTIDNILGGALSENPDLEPRAVFLQHPSSIMEHEKLLGRILTAFGEEALSAPGMLFQK